MPGGGWGWGGGGGGGGVHVLCSPLKILLFVCANMQNFLVPEGGGGGGLLFYAILLDCVYMFSYVRNYAPCVPQNRFSKSGIFKMEIFIIHTEKRDKMWWKCVHMHIYVHYLCIMYVCVHAYMLECCGYFTSEWVCGYFTSEWVWSK